MNYYLEKVTWAHEWELIRKWRNAQIDILRQGHVITLDEQNEYIKEYEEEKKLALPSRDLYMFTDGTKPIGYGGFVHIKWEDSNAEISFLIDPVKKRDLLQYTMEWLIFLKMLREQSIRIGIKTWRSETPFSTDPTRKIHVEVIRQLFKPRETMLKNSVIQEWEI